MQKIRKILRAVSEKTALPTNQPTNQPTHQPIITNNTDFIGPGWRRFKKNYTRVSQNLGNKLLQVNTYRALMSSLLKKISLNSSGQIQKTFVVFLNFQRPVSGEKPNTLKQTNNNGCEYVE